MKSDLAQLIKDNPSAVAVIDNDSWWLYREPRENNPHDEESDYEAYEKWDEQNRIADYTSIQPIGDGGYGSGNCYGGDILQALAQIVGLKVKSV